MTDFKRGDFVGFVFAQPGNDTTNMVVLEVGEKVKCWDVWFDFEIELAPERLWLLSDRELAAKVSHHKYGPVTSRERLEQVKAERCPDTLGVNAGGYWCVVCGKFLPSEEGVIVHDNLPHPEAMDFNDEETPQ